MATSAEYRLVFTDRARKDVADLDTLAKKRIGRKILDLESDPIRKSTRLVNPKLGTWRYRIGDFRVVFDVHGRDVVILRIGHRREIHR